MKGLRYFILAGIAMAAAPGILPVSAHCPGEVPKVKITHPSEGVAIQEACFSGFSTCLIDTFYSAKLLEELSQRFRNSKYAVFAYVDSVHNFYTYDSVYYQGQLYYVDTFTTERVQVGIHTFLKDTLPVRTLTFVDRWIAFKGDPLATTYTPLLDTPFVAFFDTYDTLENMGIGPMDGCFFEPTTFSIKAGRIHKKGAGGLRMPGVSVSTEEFFAAVGIPPVPVPPVAIFGPVGKPSRRRPLPGSRRHDLLGRVLDRPRSPFSVFSVWDTRPAQTVGEARPTEGARSP
jgi:hypothetical protein